MEFISKVFFLNFCCCLANAFQIPVLKYQPKVWNTHPLYSCSKTFDFKFDSRKFSIISFNSEKSFEASLKENEILLIDTGNGWGNGAHPTTRLCVDFLETYVKPGDTVLDYGTGSGILSIVAKKLGANQCTAVDIDEDSLAAAQRNIELNGFGEKIPVVHTRSVYIGDNSFPTSDITVANILAGPLSRLVAPLWMLTKPGGRICLSGLRPHELPALIRIYSPYVDLSTEETKLESHETFGEWVRWSARTKIMTEVERMKCMDLLTEKSTE